MGILSKIPAHVEMAYFEKSIYARQTAHSKFRKGEEMLAWSGTLSPPLRLVTHFPLGPGRAIRLPRPSQALASDLG